MSSCKRCVEQLKYSFNTVFQLDIRTLDISIQSAVYRPGMRFITRLSWTFARKRSAHRSVADFLFAAICAHVFNTFISHNKSLLSLSYKLLIISLTSGSLVLKALLYQSVAFFSFFNTPSPIVYISAKLHIAIGFPALAAL